MGKAVSKFSERRFVSYPDLLYSGRCFIALALFTSIFVLPANSKLLESGVNYDFDATGKPSFLENDSGAKSVSWGQWHANLDQAIVEKQYSLLVSKWKTRGPAFAVIDYSVTDNGHIEAHALTPEDEQFQKKFEEAREQYNMSESTALTFSSPNLQFEQLTLRAYRAMEGNPLLKFPDGSQRKNVRDVRWHIDSAKIKRSVRSQTDDVENHP